MAVPLSNHYVFVPRLAPKPSSKLTDAKSIHLPQIASTLDGAAGRGLPSSPTVRGASIRVSKRARSPLGFPFSANFPAIHGMHSTPQATRSSELGDDSMASLSLNKLIGVYREAFLSGDEKTVKEIETKICDFEVGKNQLTRKLSMLSEEMTASKEKYIRLQADFENYRKRLEKEKLTARSDTQREVIESLLPMVDNFERAKQYVRPLTDNEKKIDASYEGIYKQFVEVMRSLDVSAIASVGKPFDPALHEAIARVESQEFREGIIIQEIGRGFRLKDKILRPARVKVSAGPGSKKAKSVVESAGQPAATAGVDER